MLHYFCGCRRTECPILLSASKDALGWHYFSFLTFFRKTFYKDQGPVVQSVVSLTSSLRVISLTVLADSIYNILIFFAEKMWVGFALQKLLTFFQQKISAYLRITRLNFNESLTNDVVSFKQLGPENVTILSYHHAIWTALREIVSSVAGRQRMLRWNCAMLTLIRVFGVRSQNYWLLQNVLMESKGLDNTLHMRRMMPIRFYLKSFFRLARSRYSINSMARTRMARLPWMIRTLFQSLQNPSNSSRKQIFKDFFFLILSRNCMLCVLIRIASSRRF